MKIHLIPGYPDTSEFLRSRIAIIARIPGYIYPDISPDTIHQPERAGMHPSGAGDLSLYIALFTNCLTMVDLAGLIT